MDNLFATLDSFPRLRVLVVGEAILDGYLEGTTGRLCREAPVPVVTVGARKHQPGGAANTAANVASLGGRVDFLSAIGRDWEGRLLRRTLLASGIADDHLLAISSRETMAKFRVVADNQMLVRFDHGSETPLDDASLERLIRRMRRLYRRADAAIVSDYGLGLFAPPMIRAIGELQRETPRLLAIDSRNQLAAFRDLGATVVKPNYREVLALLPPGNRETARERAQAVADAKDAILNATGAQLAAVTLDSEGAVVFDRHGEPYRTYAEPRPESRCAGAGDTYMSALVLALAAGAAPPAAAEIAQAAAAIVVGRDGTACCEAEELRGYLAGTGKVFSDLDRLVARLRFLRERGARIVFTNGCFDILHRGHITYLNQAKAQGDVLVVAVNSDASVTRLKGSDRPVIPLEDRLQVLAALSCIDYVTTFDEDTSARLVEAIRPDVFVKGANYRREDLPEAPLVERLGGVVRLLPYVTDRSTTRIIERVKRGPVSKVRP